MPDEERRAGRTLARGDRRADPLQERHLSAVRRQPLGNVVQVVLPTPSDELVDPHDPRGAIRVDAVLDLVHVHAVRVVGQRVLVPLPEVEFSRLVPRMLWAGGPSREPICGEGGGPAFTGRVEAARAHNDDGMAV